MSDVLNWLPDTELEPPYSAMSVQTPVGQYVAFSYEGGAAPILSFCVERDGVEIVEGASTMGEAIGCAEQDYLRLMALEKNDG